MNTAPTGMLRKTLPSQERNWTRPAARPGAKRPGTPKIDVQGSSREARQLAAAILEVLAGVRSPAAAAQLLGISLPRYYAREMRALQGLLASCEARPKGRSRSPASELAAVQRECERLRRDCARQQALVRAAQRTIGLTAPPAVATKPDRSGKKRRQRKPTVRALKAAQVLKEPTPAPSVESTSAATPS
jgi:hypothetical protein